MNIRQKLKKIINLRTDEIKEQKHNWSAKNGQLTDSIHEILIPTKLPQRKL